MLMLTPLPEARGFSSGILCVKSTVLPLFTGVVLRCSSENDGLDMTPPIGPAILCLKFGRMVSNVDRLFPSHTPELGRLPMPSLSVLILDTQDNGRSGLVEGS